MLPEAMVQRAAPALVQLEMSDRLAAGFLLGARGHVVTNFHVVANARRITARRGEGPRVPVSGVVGLDARRDLAVLQVPPSLSPLSFLPHLSIALGDALVVPSAHGGLPWQGEVIGTHGLGDWLRVYELGRELPEVLSGSPLLNTDGEAVAVATVTRTSSGQTTLALPIRYLAPLLAGDGKAGLGGLQAGAGQLRRAVPSHRLSVLESSSAFGLQNVVVAIDEALNVGALAYNTGDSTACYQIYEQVALHLIRARGDCPGVLQALREGLQRASEEESDSARAWALRDTFDGIVDLVQRWFRAQASFQEAPRGTPLFIS